MLLLITTYNNKINMRHGLWVQPARSDWRNFPENNRYHAHREKAYGGLCRGALKYRLYHGMNVLPKIPLAGVNANSKPGHRDQWDSRSYASREVLLRRGSISHDMAKSSQVNQFSIRQL